jgi:hypothetical protein
MQVLYNLSGSLFSHVFSWHDREYDQTLTMPFYQKLTMPFSYSKSHSELFNSCLIYSYMYCNPSQQPQVVCELWSDSSSEISHNALLLTSAPLFLHSNLYWATSMLFSSRTIETVSINLAAGKMNTDICIVCRPYQSDLRSKWLFVSQSSMAMLWLSWLTIV